MLTVTNRVVKAVGPDRVGVIEQAWPAGSQVLKGGLIHPEPVYLVNWGGVTCYEHDKHIVLASA